MKQGQHDIESILWDCVTAPTDDDSHLAHQSSGITKLAELIARQAERISDLEEKVAELHRRAEAEGPR